MVDVLDALLVEDTVAGIRTSDPNEHVILRRQEVGDVAFTLTSVFATDDCVDVTAMRAVQAEARRHAHRRIDRWQFAGIVDHDVCRRRERLYG